MGRRRGLLGDAVRPGRDPERRHRQPAQDGPRPLRHPRHHRRRPEHWPNLQPGVLGKAFETINFSQQGWEMLVFRQELARSHAQGPDIYFSVVEGLRTGKGSPLGRLEVRRVCTSGASGGTQILRPLAQYHHDNWMQPDGGPILDGYFIMVGQLPEHRPAKAAVVVFQTEAEALTANENGWDLPEDTDVPKTATTRSRAPVTCSARRRRRRTCVDRDVIRKGILACPTRLVPRRRTALRQVQRPDRVGVGRALPVGRRR